MRVRGVIEALLRLPGYRGVLAYTLAEALWLAETVDDVVVGYPTRRPRGHRARSRPTPELASRVTLMVDSPAQLDLVDACCRPAQRETIRVCLELDASWDAPVLGHLGVWRSPVHTADAGGTSRADIVARPGFELVGMMAYEAQIAGRRQPPRGQARRRRGQPLDAVALDAPSCSSVARGRSRPCASSPTSSSSTAAAPGRSSARRPTRR